MWLNVSQSFVSKTWTNKFLEQIILWFRSYLCNQISLVESRLWQIHSNSMLFMLCMLPSALEIREESQWQKIVFAMSEFDSKSDAVF